MNSTVATIFVFLRTIKNTAKINLNYPLSDW